MTGGGPGAPLCWATWLGWAIMPGLMPPAWPCWGCPGMPPGLGYLQQKSSAHWLLVSLPLLQHSSQRIIGTMKEERMQSILELLFLLITI